MLFDWQLFPFEVFVSKGIEPISDKEYNKFLKWYKKTPLGKERFKFNKWADGKRELEAKAIEKQKKWDNIAMG